MNPEGAGRPALIWKTPKCCENNWPLPTCQTWLCPWDGHKLFNLIWSSVWKLRGCWATLWATVRGGGDFASLHFPSHGKGTFTAAHKTLASPGVVRNSHFFARVDFYTHTLFFSSPLLFSFSCYQIYISWWE